MAATVTTICPICGQVQEWISRDHVPVLSKHEWRCVEVNPLMIWGSRIGYYKAEYKRNTAKSFRLTKM